MKIYIVRIKGLSPLLHHGSQAVGMEEKSSKKKGGNALLGDPEEWKKTIYYSEENGVYMPAINLEGTFINASKQFKIGRGTVKKYFESGVFIDGIELPFWENGKHLMSYDDVNIDKRTVKNPTTKGRNCRYRAIFKNWESEFTMRVVADEYINSSMLKEILEYGGLFIGVCDYRPRFGRFEVIKFEEVEAWCKNKMFNEDLNI